MLEEELAALKALGQRLADGLLDDARTGKPDERLRLGDVDVAEHGEARRDAAGRRIGEDGDVGQPGAVEAASAALILAICISDSAPSIMRAPPEHETMMTGSAPAIARSIARVIFSPTTTPMLPPMNAYSMAATTVSMPSIRPGGGDHGVFQAGGRDAGVEPLTVRLGVGELAADRSTSARRRIPVQCTVEQRPQPFGRDMPEVVPALRADARGSPRDPCCR